MAGSSEDYKQHGVADPGPAWDKNSMSELYDNMRRIKIAEAERAEKSALERRRYQDMVMALEGHATASSIVNPMRVGTVKDIVKERIEHHQRMIKTLEWFGAHLGLDDPEMDTLVGRVIVEGLRVMAKGDKEPPF
jgi:hypothetical protein